MVIQRPPEHASSNDVARPSGAGGARRLADIVYEQLFRLISRGEFPKDCKLPPEGELIASSRVTAAYDKGAGKGAVIYTETIARSAGDGQPMFTLLSSTFARGDGGFGGPAGSGPQPHAIPERRPDRTVVLQTRKDQALFYRLNGDRNPLHADPDLAKRVGFPAPILHGLCTYGIACRAILQSVAAYDSTRITGFDVRFSAPVYPGEAIATDLWIDGNTVSFRCRIPARDDVVVINNGRCMLAA